VRGLARRSKEQETGDTFATLVVQAAGYFVLTGAVVWLMLGYLK
jgi:hypothetical protein